MVGKIYRSAKQFKIISVTCDDIARLPRWAVHRAALDSLFWDGTRSDEDKVVTYTSTWGDVQFTIVAEDMSTPGWEVLN